MPPSSSAVILLTSILTVMTSTCSHKPSPETLAKIQFDYSGIDDAGLYRGETAVEYEFCIPAEEVRYNEVLKINSSARLMKSSKGRIRCQEHQWLCIASTHHPQWKKQLYDIASFPFVTRILQTHYE